jgi:hypothetical protein
MGVGVGYTGEDSGWTKAAEKAAESIGGLVGSFKGIKDSIAGPLGAARDRLVAFKNALPENLTTGYESQLVAADKAGRSLAAQLGYGSKQMGKFTKDATNMGISLNRSTEEAGRAIFAWDRGSDVLKAVGIDSAETALKVGDLGIDMKNFTYSLKELKTGLNLNDAALKKVTDSTLAWGQQSGDVTGVMNAMQEQVEHLSKRAHQLGRNLSGDELANWAENTNQAKQALFTLIPNAAKASAAVDQMSDMALENGRVMGAMFAGAENDLPQTMKAFAIAGLDVEKQFKMMEKGPLGFIQGLSEMAAATGKPFKEMTTDQKNFIEKTIASSGLGEEAQQALWKAMNVGPTALQGIIDKLPKATENIGKLGKEAFRTGRTTSEWLQLYKDQFTTALRSSRKVEVTVTKNGKTYKKMIPVAQKYLEDSKKGFADLSKRLTDLSKDNGPLGQVAGKIMDIQILGAAGLLPESMRAYVPVLEELTKQFGPILMGLGQMMPLITALASPVVILVAAFAGLAFWFISAQKAGDSFSDTVGTMQQQAMSFFDSMESWLGKKFPKHINTIHAIVTVLKFAFYVISEGISQAITGFGLIFDFIERALGGQTTFWKDFGEMVKNIWQYGIVDPIKNYFAEMWLNMKAAAMSGFGDLKALVSGAVDFIAKVLKAATDPLVAPFVAIDQWVSKLFRNSISTDIQKDLKIAMELFDGFGRTAGKVLSAVLSPLSALLPSVASATGGGGKSLPPPMKPAPAVSAGDRDASLVAAVHAPNWYARYEQVFNARMQALEMAVASSGGAPAKGGKTSASAPKSKGASGSSALGGRLAFDAAGSPRSE